MLLLVAVLVCCQLVFSSPAGGEEETFPYKTFIAADDVYVRSGPGQSYYPTDKLRRGQEVEVYRHDPGGWCAIRPVEGSFTWVSSRYLKPDKDGLAVVTEDGVSARVGSRFSQLRDVIQVRLNKGEVVEPLDQPQGDGWGDRAWVRIAPPAGEFRWVSAKYLDAEYPSDGVRQSAAGHRKTSTAGESLADRSAQSRVLSGEQFQAELEQIELELSLMLVEEPGKWSFDALRERTNMLLDQSQTAVERGRARLLANKIARFDDIKQRHDAVLALSPRSRSVGSDEARPEQSPSEIQIDGRFDGVGQLTQVVSPKLGAPRYALTDQEGKVRCYVTPVPGVNVDNYLGRTVGVIGTRGYMPEQRTSHIMARRFTPLEGSMLR